MPQKNKSSRTGVSGHAYSFRKAGPYLSIGYVFLGSIAFFAWGGYLLDGYFQTGGLILIPALLLALGLSFYRMILVLKNTDTKK